jgi:hypothetical protein
MDYNAYGKIMAQVSNLLIAAERRHDHEDVDVLNNAIMAMSAVMKLTSERRYQEVIIPSVLG